MAAMYTTYQTRWTSTGQRIAQIEAKTEDKIAPRLTARRATAGFPAPPVGIVDGPGLVLDAAGLVTDRADEGDVVKEGVAVAEGAVVEGASDGM